MKRSARPFHGTSRHAGRQAVDPMEAKGAMRCPACGSRRTTPMAMPENAPKFYAREVRVCMNPACRTVWEPFTPADQQDPEEPNGAFREPCGNCAFRPGAPEQEDPKAWAVMVARLKSDGMFFCHKGVPINVENGVGFSYPEHGGGKSRICAGFIAMRRRLLPKREDGK